MSRHKTSYVISYHGIFMSRHVVCHDYRGIPSSYVVVKGILLKHCVWLISIPVLSVLIH